MSKMTYLQKIEATLADVYEALPDEQQATMLPLLQLVMDTARGLQDTAVKKMVQQKVEIKHLESDVIKLQNTVKELINDGKAISDSDAVARIAYKLDIGNAEAQALYDLLTVESDDPDDAFALNAVRMAFLQQIAYNAL